MPKLSILPTRSAAHVADPLRAELAAAIEAARAARAALGSTRAATQRALDMVQAAEGALAAARENTEAARQAQTARITEAATTGTPPAPDRSIREARLAEADAEDQLTIARDVLRSIEATLAEPEIVARRAEGRLDAAADAIVATAVAKLVHEAEAIQDDLTARRHALAFLQRAALVSADDRASLDRFLGRNVLPGGYGAVMPWELLEAHKSAAEAAGTPLRAFREALKIDPDAPLPVR